MFFPQGYKLPYKTQASRNNDTRTLFPHCPVIWVDHESLPGWNKSQILLWERLTIYGS